MELKINHLRMDLDDFSNWNRNADVNKTNPIIDRLAVLGCGDVQTLSDIGHGDLGYAVADVSLGIGYKYLESLQTMDLAVAMTGHE